MAAVVERLRAKKTPEELAWLRIASERVVESMLATIAAHGPGTTKLDMVDALRREEVSRGLTFEYCLITEELARGWMSVASIIARGNGLSAGRGMTEEQRAVFLPRAARGEFLGAAAMSEPNVGSDLGSIACRARRDGDDWVITGNKYW